jgi:HNH endonuclease
MARTAAIASPDAFWASLRRTERECWEWTGKTFGGYGTLWYQGVQWRTHRLAFALTHGSVPDGLDVCHTCDNPCCCNPEHLWAGTHAENMADKVRKGRQPRKNSPPVRRGRLIAMTDKISAVLDEIVRRESLRRHRNVSRSDLIEELLLDRDEVTRDA